jgi:hypothetical protein
MRAAMWRARPSGCGTIMGSAYLSLCRDTQEEAPHPNRRGDTGALWPVGSDLGATGLLPPFMLSFVCRPAARLAAKTARSARGAKRLFAHQSAPFVLSLHGDMKPGCAALTLILRLPYSVASAGSRTDLYGYSSVRVQLCTLQFDSVSTWHRCDRSGAQAPNVCSRIGDELMSRDRSWTPA